MDKSIVKDVMMASGLTVDAVCEALNAKLNWGVEAVKKWFGSRVYEPKTTAKGLPYTQVSKKEWDAIFEVINASDAVRAEVKATVNALKGAMKTADHALSTEELEAAYNSAYDNRAELAAKEAELAAEKAAKAAAKAEKKASESKSTEDQINDLMAELGEGTSDVESLIN